MYLRQARQALKTPRLSDAKHVAFIKAFDQIESEEDKAKIDKIYQQLTKLNGMGSLIALEVLEKLCVKVLCETGDLIATKQAKLKTLFDTPV
jgi:DNA-binding Xre family transcriptional regulator